MGLLGDISNLTIAAGQAKARGQRESGQIYGSLLSNLGQIPGQVIGQIADAKAAKKQEQITDLRIAEATSDMQAKAAAAAKQQRIAGAFQKHGKDIDGAIDEVMSIDPLIGMDLSKRQADARASGWNFKEAKIKADRQAAEYLGQLTGAATDQATYTQKLYEAQHAGLDVSKFPPDFEAAKPFIKAAQQSALTVQQRLDAEQKAIDDAREDAKLREAARQNLATEAANAIKEAQSDADRKADNTRADAQLRVSQGQLGVAQARERREATGGGNDPLVPIVGPDGKPVLVRRNDAVGKTPASAATSGKPGTGAQNRVLGFFNRAKQADDDMQRIEADVAGMGYVGQEWMKRAPNVLQTQTGQSYNQAQRAFTEARLRKDSGAAIPDAEFENDRVTYFAQPGDSTATLDQKRRARAAVLASLGFEAGPALSGFYGDDADALMQGYRDASKKADPAVKWVMKDGKLVKQ